MNPIRNNEAPAPSSHSSNSQPFSPSIAVMWYLGIHWWYEPEGFGSYYCWFLDTGTPRAVPGNPVVPGLNVCSTPVHRAHPRRAIVLALHADRLIMYPELLVSVPLKTEVGLRVPNPSSSPHRQALGHLCRLLPSAKYTRPPPVDFGSGDRSITTVRPPQASPQFSEPYPDPLPPPPCLHTSQYFRFVPTLE